MFQNNTLDSPKRWLDAGYRVFPCQEKKPLVEWKTENKKIFYDGNAIGLYLQGVTDFDVDNPTAHNFIKEYLKPCGAVYGRHSNPNSHYLFKGDYEFKQYVFPKSLENHVKEFAHGLTIGEIRNGEHYSIVPNSKIDGEKVEWSKFIDINEYDGDLVRDIGLIMFSTAMAILYPQKGQRDNFCTAMAGALAKNTDWDGSYIDSVVFNIAKYALNKDENYMKKGGKGTNARNAIKGKKKVLGMPTLAEILNVPLKDITILFSWVGVKYEGEIFSNLKIYNTVPKYYEMQVEGNVIRIMNTKDLMSYAAVQVIIEEQLLKTAPMITPKQWREIRQGLYDNAKIVEVPIEQSFTGIIQHHFINFVTRHESNMKENLFDYQLHMTWHDRDNKRYVFRLEGFRDDLMRHRISFEQRQMTAMLTDVFRAKPIKIYSKRKEVRCWECPVELVEKYQNSDWETYNEVRKKRFEESMKTAPNLHKNF